MPKTKSTPRPAQSQANQKQAAPAAQPTAAQPELPHTHAIIVDAVTEMLTHGGHRDDVDSLLYAVIGHTHRRALGSGTDRANDEKRLMDSMQHYHPELRLDLEIGWRQNRKPESPARVEAKTISERIRENLREELGRTIATFVRSAAPDEQYLMVEILRHWDSVQSIMPTRADGEVCLGVAFYAAIGEDAGLIKVPSRMVQQVQKYVDALWAIEDKAAA